nr:putative ribonuclease H-like domain-containing protein [Tanacetum cinerariifolium]
MNCIEEIAKDAKVIEIHDQLLVIIKRQVETELMLEEKFRDLCDEAYNFIKEIEDDDLEELSLDDLFNSLKIYEAEGSVGLPRIQEGIVLLSHREGLSQFQPSDGYHAVLPPYTGTFMPPKPDLVFNTAPTAVETGHSAFTVQHSVKHVETTIPATTPKPASPKPASSSKRRNRKACFMCKSVDHLIKDCDYHAKKIAQPIPRNHAHRGNHKQYAPLTHTNPKKHMVPIAVLTQSKPVSITAVRPVSAVVPKFKVTQPRHAKPFVTKSKSPIRRHLTHSPSPMTSNSPPRVTAVKALVASVIWGNPQHALKDNGVINSGCSRHMTGNMSYLSDFEELNGGYVAFGGNPKGGKIFEKGKIKTSKLDFDDVYFVKELKFNFFSVSQMCDKKNSVLFTSTECLILSPDFKLPNESQVLLRFHRENNMYNVNLKNIVPSGDLTCLFEKATIDESNLWHRRLGHINFKAINKLVKGNLVRGLPTKVFEHNNTCVACKKGKQHRTSCKTKPVSSVDQPLYKLHMDLFGPTFVKSLNKKSYCLVVTDDYSRLQTLVDRKKVVVTEATIREALRLDVAEGVDCLSNEEIFAELARMGYEKPSTKLTLYNAFFLSQWKFLIHTILQCMSAKRTSWNEFSSSMASAVICLSSGDLSTHTTKYTSPALTQKEIDEEGDTNEHVKEVNTGDAAEGDDSAAHGEVPTVAETQSIPSPTPPTPPPQPPQDIPSTSYVQQTPPQSPQVQPLSPQPQPQPQQAADFPMSLLQKAMDACVALTRRVKHLEYDKGKMIAKIDQDDAVVLKDDKEEDKEVADIVKDVKEAKVVENAQVQGRQAKSQAEIYKIDMDHANKVLSMQEDETEPPKVQEVVDVVTTAKLITKVVTAASETVIAASPKPLKKKQQIKQDEQYARELHAELNKDIYWDEAIDHVKRKAKEDPANVASFKLDYFKGMSYDDIRLIFEAKFNSNVDFFLKTKEQIEEDESKALQKINETLAEKAAKRRKLDDEVEELKRHHQIVPNKDDDVYTEATPLARKVPVVDYAIIKMNNKPYYKIIRADGTHELYISFLTLLRNFDREDLEALWSLVKERFSTAKPKNFSDDFLLTTLGAMFETLDAHA